MQSVSAVEFGKNTKNDPFPSAGMLKPAYEWAAHIPKVWTGVYDGNSGSTHVRRKYAFIIETVNMNDGTFTGKGYVDRYPNSKHPENQVRCSYKLKGTLDTATHGISFQGTEFIQYISNFSFVKFDAVISDDYKRIDGSTDAWSGAEVHLKAATQTLMCFGETGNSFDYNENVMEPFLVENCAEYSLLAYEDSRLEATGYYVSAKGAGNQPLYDKLYQEGFQKDNIKEKKSSAVQGDSIDSIHWYYAHKTLDDGTELVYIINRGTYREEWYGDFNVTGTTDSYNGEYDGRHYSFEMAANALLYDLQSMMSDKNGNPKFDKVKYVVTGHSRGAAVANLVAKELTDRKSTDSSIKGVYGYTFATPSVINNGSTGNYTNIFNFCLDDDFVTYMPLADNNWQYGKYGTTYYACAAELYKNNKYFRSMMNSYRQYDDGTKLSYKTRGAYGIANFVLANCVSVKDYYTKKYGNDAYSWYDYFYNFFATLMYDFKKLGSKMEYYTGATRFQQITHKFVLGGVGYSQDAYYIAAYLGTHDACNYYGLAKCVVADPDVVSTDSDLRFELSAKYPYDENRRNVSLRSSGSNGTYNDDDLNSIKTLLNTGNNAEIIGWDPEDPSSWQGVTWENGRITAIDISGYGLEGVLDVTACTELRSLDCSGNLLSVLRFSGCPLNELSCEGNLLEANEDGELWSDVSALAEKGNFVYSLYPQGIAEGAEFDSAEVAKLRGLAQNGNNNTALGWKLDSPGSFSGIVWTRIGDVYHVESISLTELGLSGSADLSGMEYVRNIDMSLNELTGVNVSNCSRLKNLNISCNKVTHISYSGCPLYSLICDHNYITGDEYEELSRLADLETSEGGELVVALEPQYISAGADAFDENDLAGLRSLTSGLDMEVDWNHPGDNDYFRWKQDNGIYRLTGIDLFGQGITGSVDLTGFDHLVEINLGNTDVRQVKVPQSLVSLCDRAFADCRNLEDLYICDTWNNMGTDVFRNCDNLTIHCTRDSFASFIADALGIKFDEVVALDYITVQGDQAKKAYVGEEYSLNGSKLIAHYTDGTEKEIESGFRVENFDNTQMGSQTIKFIYSEGDYIRELEYDITVYGKTAEGLIYRYNGSDISIVGYSGNNSYLQIPEMIDDRVVKYIDADAFRDNSVIRKASIPGCVKELGARAFSGCSNLSEISLAEGLESIGNSAFQDCTSLVALIMPDSISSLGTYIFDSCHSLTHVKLNNTRVNVMEGLFYDCTALTKVDIPETVKNIRYSAFYNCTSLTNVNFPAGLELIESYAFENCYSLTEVTIPENVTSIGSGAFRDCINLKNAEIKGKVSNISSSLFRGCENLTSVSIPDSVINIYGYAFEGCTNLHEIALPVSLEYISYDVFYDSGVTNIVYAGTVEDWKKIEINESGNDVISKCRIYCTADGQTIEPSSQPPAPDTDVPANKSGEDSSFAPADNITPETSADITNGALVALSAGTFKVISVANRTVAYTKAPNKNSVTVPATVTINGKKYSVTEINTNAFKGKKIRTVTIGKNVKKIKKNAFRGSAATKLIVKTKKLKKATVKGSLKGSKVKTIQVKVGKKADNKKYVKAYKKIFTKSNAGKKVTVK